MSRRTLRWLVFWTLVAGVVLLSVYNSISNARLLNDLQTVNDADRSRAFATLSERQDSFNLLQSLEPAERTIIAGHLGRWNDPRAAKLAVILLRDTDPGVRAALTNAIAIIAQVRPDTVTGEMAVTGAVERAGLLDGTFEAGDAGLLVAESAFGKEESRDNASTLLVRFSGRSIDALSRLLRSEDRVIALAAADTMSRIGGALLKDKAAAARIRQLYSTAGTNADRDRLFISLADFAPRAALTEFIQTLQNPVAPVRLRAAAAQALGKLGNLDPLPDALADTDRGVAEAAARALAGAGADGARLAAGSSAGARIKAESLGLNTSAEAEKLLIAASRVGQKEAVAALGGRKSLSKAGFRILDDLLNSSSSPGEVRHAAAYALAAQGEEGIAILLESLSNPVAGWPAADALASSDISGSRLSKIADSEGAESHWARIALTISESRNN